MINFAEITAAVEALLNENLADYTITRNERRNEDASLAAQGNGWIGIYRGRLVYDPHTTGSRRWLTGVEITVELQCANMQSGAKLEESLTKGENEILDVLNVNTTLKGTVAHTVGYEITYEFNESSDVEAYYQAALITVKAEVRT